MRSLLPELDVTGAIGVAGTVTTAAAIELADGSATSGVRLKWDTDWYPLLRASVDAIAYRLARMPLADREQVPGLEPARAPVIVAGLVVQREILDRYGLAELEVSKRDLLDGAALAAAELPAQGEVPAPTVRVIGSSPP